MSRELVLSRARELAGIGVFKPGSAAGAQESRSDRGFRSVKLFDASMTSRLTADWQPIERLSADAELQGRLPIIRSRARDHERNDPYAEGYYKLRENNVVGHEGFTLQMKIVKSQTEDAATGELVTTYDVAAGRMIEKAWRRFCQKKNFLVTRDMHATEACKLWERTYNRDGDLLIRKIKGAPNEFGFALQPLEADYLDDQFIEFRGVPCNCPFELTLPDGSPFPYCQRRFHEVRMGVELHGDWGFPVGYWILGNHPGDYFYGNQYASRRVRVRVDEVIHPYVHKRIGQTRGIPAMVAAMIRLQQIGGMDEAALVAARTAAEKFGVITKDVPEDFMGDEQGDGDQKGFNPNALSGRILESSPGELLELPMGFKIESIDWKTPDETYAPFQTKQLRGVGAGVGVSYSSLANDPSDANFSATRIGMLEEREGYRGGQCFFINHLLLEIFPDWLESAMLRGIVDLPFARFDDYTDPEAVRFHGRGFPWIDPQKDIAAAEASVALGVDTRSRIAAENAGDFEEITAELKREKELRTAAGLEDPPAPAPGAAAPTDNNSPTKSLESSECPECRRVASFRSSDGHFHCGDGHEWSATKMLTTSSPIVATNLGAAYGYCPECGKPGVARERRPNGNDRCSDGHSYPSKTAKTAPLTAPAAETPTEEEEEEAIPPDPLASETIAGLPSQGLPPGAPLTIIKSAFLGDAKLSELPESVRKTAAQFHTAPDTSRVARYGMTVPELLPKADPHNLETARGHAAKMTQKAAREAVKSDPEKHILLVNDRIVDGHHHLAKAERGKLTRSLPVLDLTPLRFQEAEFAAGYLAEKCFPDLKSALASEIKGWVTIDGNHVYIDEGGKAWGGKAAYAMRSVESTVQTAAAAESHANHAKTGDAHAHAAAAHRAAAAAHQSAAGVPRTDTTRHLHQAELHRQYASYHDFQEQVSNHVVRVIDKGPNVDRHVEDLRRSPQIAKKVAELGGKFIISERAVTGVPGYESLKGVRPRGWKRGTWDDVGGMYDSGSKEILAGKTLNSGSASTVLHEAGHAIGELGGYDNLPEVIAAHNEFFDRTSSPEDAAYYDYFRQGGRGGLAGREEFFAESLAQTIKDKELARSNYGENIVSFLEKEFGL